MSTGELCNFTVELLESITAELTTDTAEQFIYDLSNHFLPCQCKADSCYKTHTCILSVATLVPYFATKLAIVMSLSVEWKITELLY